MDVAGDTRGSAGLVGEHSLHASIGLANPRTWPAGPLWDKSSAPNIRFVCALADCRLYNREHLRTTLDLLPEHGDGQILVAAYDRWGDECVRQLDGDFAFVIHDTVARHVFAATDCFAVKPLFYARVGQRVVFAHSAAALAAVNGRGLNERRVGQYLAGVAPDQGSTFFEGVHRLPPAHSLVADDRSTRLVRYWSPRVCMTSGASRDLVEGYRAVLKASVSKRLTDSTGITLSGGIDSSSIAQIARGSSEHKLHVFSFCFEDMPVADERDYIRETIGRGPAVHVHLLRADTSAPLVRDPVIFRHPDGPCWGGMLYAHQLVFRAARKAGVGVLLDGAWGDDVVSTGHGLLPQLMWQGRWWRLGVEVDGLARRWNCSRRAVLKTWLWPEVAPLGLRTLARRLRRRLDPSHLVRPGLRKLVAGEVAPSPWLESERHLHVLQDGYRLEPVDFMSRLASHTGVEIRFPFLDRELAEFCLAVPSEIKLFNGWNRYLARLALEHDLPRRVCWRGDKTAFERVVRRGVALYDRKLIEAVIGGPGNLQQYVDMAVLRKMARGFLRGDAGFFSGPILAAVTLAIWLDGMPRELCA